jgi:hypothetical protein
VPRSEDDKTMTASTEAGRKKPYTSPKLVSIKLRPEEAVLGSCKVTALGAGKSPSGCTYCGVTFGAS